MVCAGHLQELEYQQQQSAQDPYESSVSVPEYPVEPPRFQPQPQVHIFITAVPSSTCADYRGKVSLRCVSRNLLAGLQLVDLLSRFCQLKYVKLSACHVGPILALCQQYVALTSHTSSYISRTCSSKITQTCQGNCIYYLQFALWCMRCLAVRQTGAVCSCA